MARVSNKAPDGQELESYPMKVVEGDFGEVLISGYEGMVFESYNSPVGEAKTEGRVVVTVISVNHVTRLSLSTEDVDRLTWALVDAGKWAQDITDQKRVVKIPHPPMTSYLGGTVFTSPEEGEPDAQD